MPSTQYEPNRLLQAGAYLLAATAGIATGAVTIWSQSYDKIKKQWGGRQLVTQRNKMIDTFERLVHDPSIAPEDIPNKFRQELGIAAHPILHKAERLDELYALVDKIDLKPKANSREYAQIGRKGGAEFNQAVQEWYTRNYKFLQEQKDFHTTGWKEKILGLGQQFEELSSAKKFGVAFSTVVSVGSVVGAYMLINQNMRLKTVNKQQDKNMEELGRRIDEQEKHHAKQLEAASAGGAEAGASR